MLSAALAEENRNSKNYIDSSKQDWKVRIGSIHEEWNKNRKNYWDTRLERECPVFSSCDSCSKDLKRYVVCCKNCKQELCAACDSRIHGDSPFHGRTLYKTIDMSSVKLLSLQIVDQETLLIGNRGNQGSYR